MVIRYKWDSSYKNHVDERGYGCSAVEIVGADDYDALKARLAEAVECCTIKDNRNLWLEIRLKKIMARCADLLDEDQFNELDALARSADARGEP